MALFGSVSGKEVDRFAKELAEGLAKQYPPALDKGGERMLSEKRLTRILEEVCSHAAAFKNEHKLGVYKKARLGNTFRWELEELGPSGMVGRLHDFVISDAAWCTRFGGYLEKVLLVTGARDVDLQETRCRARGDECCKFVGVWK